MNKNKFLVFSYYSNKVSGYNPHFELSKITTPTFEQYCKIHNYDFCCRNVDFNRLGWAKLDIFLEESDKYDWIFYVECDSMLMNETIRLENLIDNNYELIISKTNRTEYVELNTGPMLMKCSEWNRIFFDEILNNKNYQSNLAAEQSALMNEVNTNENIKKKIKLVELRYFNSLYHQWHPYVNFKIGDFITHSAGCSMDFRFKLFNELKNHIIKVPDYKIPFEPFI